MSRRRESKGLITRNDVFVYDALKTPQFWLIWWVLCLNVTAGIGVLGQASAMSQEMFPGHITPVAAAGFVGLMSLFNMGGRFVWASTSDYIGRRNTYFVFMVLGFVAVLRGALYRIGRQRGRVRAAASWSSSACMAAASPPCRPISRDMFGTRYVGAIHGLLLTAWSMAGIFGPVLVNYIREYNVTHGVPKAQAYNTTMYIMAGLLVIGFICNFFVKAVDALPYEGNDDRGPSRPRKCDAGRRRRIRGTANMDNRKSTKPRPRCNSCSRGASSVSRWSGACCRPSSTR